MMAPSKTVSSTLSSAKAFALKSSSQYLSVIMESRGNLDHEFEVE